MSATCRQEHCKQFCLALTQVFNLFGHFYQPIKDSKSSGAAALDPGSWPRTPTEGVRVEKVRHDDDGHALAGGIAPTALFPEPPPPSEVASRAKAATRPAFSGAHLVVFFVYIPI